MLNIHTLTLGAYQTNTYIVHDTDADVCTIIDPGYGPDTILEKVRELGLSVDAILLTHGHFDHVGAVEQIVSATGCKLWMSESDWSQFPNPVTAFFYPIANCDFCVSAFGWPRAGWMTAASVRIIFPTIPRCRISTTF